jgi:16S rRNA processing protein RimM
MTQTMTDIYLGRIVKAFGIRGELKFHPSVDFWEDTLGSKQLTMRTQIDGDVVTRPVEFRTSRPHGRSYVVRMDGVNDRSAAEALVGSNIFIGEDDVDVTWPEHALPYQLVGLTVTNEEGETRGEVTSIIHSEAHDVYEITGQQGAFLVPAVPEFVVSIDLESAKMVLRPIPGLIDE